MDGGNSHPFKGDFSKRKTPPPTINMVIVTHIDRDHIGGIIKVLQDEDHLKNIKYLLFNEPEQCNLFYAPNDSAEVNAEDGNSLLNILKKNTNLQYIKSIHNLNSQLENTLSDIIPNTKIKILSPSPEGLSDLLSLWDRDEFKKENNVCAEVMNSITGDVTALADMKYELDSKIPNKSSIALLLTHNNKNFLLLGDAHITEINKSLIKMGAKEEPLDVEFVKLSHHGSIKNINKDFLGLIKTNKYIICNPSPKSKKLPNKETIAQIAFYGQSANNDEPKEILLTKNTKADLKFSENDHIKFNFKILKQDSPLEF